jgi:hypothetical protein
VAIAPRWAQRPREGSWVYAGERKERKTRREIRKDETAFWKKDRNIGVGVRW